jgi:hypothetical protein
MDVVAKAVSKGPISWASNSPLPTWSSDRDCAGACCSSRCPSVPNSYVGAPRATGTATRGQDKGLQRRKERAPWCSAGIPGIFSRISLAPHSGYARVQMILALRILHFEDLSVGMTEF